MLSPGLIDLAIQRNSLIGGDDFKSGQTKMKSVLVDFLVGAGIKVQSSYYSYLLFKLLLLVMMYHNVMSGCCLYIRQHKSLFSMLYDIK